MLPYLILMTCVAVFGLAYCETARSRRRDFVFLAVTGVVLVALSALRGESVGVDYPVYADFFRNVCQGGWQYVVGPENPYRNEMGYSLLNYAVSLVTQDVHIFMAVVAVVMVGLTVWFVAWQSYSPWLSMFVFVAFGFFGYTLCTLRQQMAICIAMFALPCLRERRLLPYLAIVALSGTFHNSLLILVPVYWMVLLPLKNWLLGLMLGGTAFLWAFSLPILKFFSRFGYEWYFTGSQYYLQGRNLSTAVVPILLMAASWALRRQLLAADARNGVYIHWASYAGCLFVLTLQHFLFQRLALIFLPVSIVLLPEFLHAFDLSPRDREEMASLKAQMAAAPKPERARLAKQWGALRERLATQRTFYQSVLGFILFFSAAYQLFLLAANRLDLVPFVFLWQ